MNRGVLIQMGKVDFVDNIPTQGIEIIGAGRDQRPSGFASANLLPCRISYRVRNVKEDAWDDYSDAYSDYKPSTESKPPCTLRAT